MVSGGARVKPPQLPLSSWSNELVSSLSPGPLPLEQHPTKLSLPQLLGAAKPEALLTSHQHKQCYSALRQLPPSN